MTIFGKVWGRTRPCLVTPLIEIHEIEVYKKGATCSLHKHERKWNAFYLLNGELDIEVYKNDYNLVDVTHLREDEQVLTTVPPGEYHRFKLPEGSQYAKVLEIYYLEPLTSDIIRKGTGSSEEDSKAIDLTGWNNLRQVNGGKKNENNET